MTTSSSVPAQWATVRIGWVPVDRFSVRRCLRQDKDEQPCSAAGGRYRIIARSPIATLDGHLCANHLARLAPALGIDSMRVGPWKEDQ